MDSKEKSAYDVFKVIAALLALALYAIFSGKLEEFMNYIASLGR